MFHFSTTSLRYKEHAKVPVKTTAHTLVYAIGDKGESERFSKQCHIQILKGLPQYKGIYLLLLDHGNTTYSLLVERL
jgi:hypothetical protein